MSDSPALRGQRALADPHLVYDPVAGDGPKDVVILGSTGSIGTQAIDLVLRNPEGDALSSHTVLTATMEA